MHCLDYKSTYLIDSARIYAVSKLGLLLLKFPSCVVRLKKKKQSMFAFLIHISAVLQLLRWKMDARELF